MDAFMNFQFGWLNKEKLIFLLGLCVILFGLFTFFTGNSEGYSIPDKVVFNTSDDVMIEPFPSIPSSRVKGMIFPEKPRDLFLLLDAPQLNIDSPVPPTFGVPIVLPPAYPQPSSKGNGKTDAGGK